MCMKTIYIQNSRDLLSQLLSYDSGWLFRGHAKAEWALESTLERVLKPLGWDSGMAQRCEKYSLHVFRSKAHHYISRDKLPETKLGYMSLMQHHGVPTRLLDFTESPFIGLFFAFESVSPDQPEPCAIYAIEHRELMKGSVDFLNRQIANLDLTVEYAQMNPDEVFEQHIYQNAYDILWVSEPLLHNLRLERQRGTFIMSGNAQKRIMDILPSSVPSSSINKLVFPAALASDVFELLRKMGIDDSRLFSDLDGLARDLRRMMTYQVHKVDALRAGS